LWPSEFYITYNKKGILISLLINFIFQIYHEDESSIHVSTKTDSVPTTTDSKKQETDLKPKLCTVTSQGGIESKISCSGGPVAIQLQGNKDQSKKMAAMSTVDTQPPMDISPNEEKQGLPVAEKDKTKAVNDARMQKAQIGLKEQQLEYKLRKEREYQNQLHRQARQLAKQTRPVQDPNSFHSTNPELAKIWNYGRYAVSTNSRGRGIVFEEYSAVEEDTDDLQCDDSCGASFFYSGASASQTGNYTFPVDQTEKSSTKTVRVGPGYSVLALPKSTTVTSESPITWDEVSKDDG
jgi:hypothetical protein